MAAYNRKCYESSGSTVKGARRPISVLGRSFKKFGGETPPSSLAHSLTLTSAATIVTY